VFGAVWQRRFEAFESMAAAAEMLEPNLCRTQGFAPEPDPCFWSLVWCSERCFKAENVHRRAALENLAKSSGASLVSIKKANKFAMWLLTARCKPFVLVTDWREVKPCLQVLEPQPMENQPVFTMVLCDACRNNYERAQQWASSLPPRKDPVHVVSSLDFLSSFTSTLGCKRKSPDAGIFRASLDASNCPSKDFADGTDGTITYTPEPAGVLCFWPRSHSPESFRAQSEGSDGMTGGIDEADAAAAATDFVAMPTDPVKVCISELAMVKLEAEKASLH
jgi:hypothetical protein